MNTESNTRPTQSYLYIGKDGKPRQARDMEDEIDALRAEVKRLRGALKFYAPIEIAGVRYVGGDDAGWRATAALAEAKP